MAISDTYHSSADCPDVVSVIPILGAILLPRAQIPLNIFEPRYLAMIDDALRADRLVGVIQPEHEEAGDVVPTLRSTGCLGRITQFAETGDGRYLVTLTGVSRFAVLREVPSSVPYRMCCVDYAPFSDDLTVRNGEDDADREAVLETLQRYAEQSDVEFDWEAIAEAPNEALINALSMMSPFGAAEKQALLEAADLKTRAELLVAMTEIELARSGANTEKTLQ